MLLELNVSHFAIIDKIQIEFTPGFNVLSGETGAGKSVLLKSLGLLMGAKSRSEDIQQGSSQAIIEGLFDLHARPDIQFQLQEFGIPTEDDQLIVRRVLSANGKGKIYLNGVLSTLNNLRDLIFPLLEITGPSAPLIEMTGQHDSRQLLSKSYHLEMIDQYADLQNEKNTYQRLFNHVQNLQTELQELLSDASSQAQKLDFLSFQRDEIKDLQILPGEEEDLSLRIKRLRNAQTLNDFFAEAEYSLYTHEESVIAKLYKITQQGQQLQNLHSELGPSVEILKQAKTLIEEGVFEMRDLNASFQAEDENLEHLESRLSQLKKIQKKHGLSLSQIVDKLQELEEEINKIENCDEHIERLKNQLKTEWSQLNQEAKKLHEKRYKSSQKLLKLVNKELLDLNMKGVEFSVSIQELKEPNLNGITDVEFMVKQGKNALALSIAKVASGGEMSRILLALKKSCGKGDYPRTYLFDEVDTGVSGETAEKVGKKLKSISQGQQVICITHLPQVARFADSHFLIQKSTQKQKITTEVIPLKEDLRVKEIARLISGEKITKTSLSHAKELLKH
ncbi:MAG: DNA repair protein RecN [Bdellovibrionales bacterium]|nr:DNA repair protein RecN [Bdellovibrionales bacterium]